MAGPKIGSPRSAAIFAEASFVPPGFFLGPTFLGGGGGAVPLALPPAVDVGPLAGALGAPLVVVALG